MNDKQGRIEFLDHLRIFAFISVLVGHKLFEPLKAIATDESYHIIVRKIAELSIPLCYGGAAGVVVFFLISGYIITHVLQRETSKEFLIKRAFRIYPLYATAVIIELLLNYFVSDQTPPKIGKIISRLLLTGDIFNTPYGLNGVEWTLRLEIGFYIIMAISKKIGLFSRQELLPYAYLLISTAMLTIPAFPKQGVLAHGYFTIYLSYLFVGSCIYLSQNKKANLNSCILSSVIMVSFSLYLFAKIQPAWKNEMYIAYAIAIFLIAMKLRPALQSGPVIGILSSMTFSVYLFHNWLLDYIVIACSYIKGETQESLFLPIVILLIFCYLMHKTVEKFGIDCGRTLLTETNKIDTPSDLTNPDGRR